MALEVLRILAESTVASALALALVGLLRRPLRIAVGARIAYWLWLLVPALIAAVLLPAPPAVLFAPIKVLPAQIGTALTAVAAGHPASERSVLINSVLTIWSVGAIVMMSSMFVRQRSFARTLGALARDSHGLYHGAVAAPMLVGMWHSKIIVPTDFDSRYPPEQRELVLAHERAHAARHDLLVNAIAALALCVFWFNPLAYCALVWLRADQELACDALVLLRRGHSRSHYARLLLTTQLATESAWRPPVSCHWQSVHPLKERVAMLKRPLPTRARRIAGFAFVAALNGSATFAAWAGQPATAAGPQILVDYDIKITRLQTSSLREIKTQYLVHSGETLKDEQDGLPLLKVGRLRFGCTPYLAGASAKSHGTPAPAAGQILLECPIVRDGAIMQTPAVLVQDGSPAAIETTETDGQYRYRLEVTASTSAGKIAVAKVAGEHFLAAKKQSGK